MQFQNEFLQIYMEYVEDTESPRVFHIWSALTGVAACLGRRCYYDFGIKPIYPNMYTLLIGPPGARKGTAMNIMKRLVRTATGVRFAPEDTAGQRQGLIVAMENKKEDDDDVLAQLRDEDQLSADNIDLSPEKLKKLRLATDVDPRDAHVLFATADEFSSFVGAKNMDMLRFLARMWDGDSYDYKISKAQNTLVDPLLTVIGCTTPVDIAASMPAEAVGQGFMSRLLLVFGNEKYKRIARPRQLPEHEEEILKKVYSTLFYEFDGPIKETKSAARLLDDMYEDEIKIQDPRFVYYIERRHTHLIKLCTNLAAARLSREIEIDDVQEARAILSATEGFMPEALGEFGMSPVAAAKQKIIDFVYAAKEPITTRTLWAVMHREITQRDFPGALIDLCNAGKIKQVQTVNGPAYVAVRRFTEETESLLSALPSEEDDAERTKNDCAADGS